MNLLGDSLFHQVKLLADLSNFLVRGRVLTFRIVLKANNMREKKELSLRAKCLTFYHMHQSALQRELGYGSIFGSGHGILLPTYSLACAYRISTCSLSFEDPFSVYVR